MLEGGRMKNEISAWDGATAGFKVSNVTNVELNLVCHIRVLCLIFVTHIILLFLITGEDAYFTNICTEEALQDSVSEGSCASCDKEDLVFKN